MGFKQSFMLSSLCGACFLPAGDKIWWASGWASERWAADSSGEAEEADAKEESRVRLPDPPGEDGTAASGAPGPSMIVIVKLCEHRFVCVWETSLGWRDLTSLFQRWMKSVIICISTKNLSIHHFLSECLQRIRDLEDKTEIQRRQIKDLEEKVGHVLCLSVVSISCSHFKSVNVFVNYMKLMMEWYQVY